MFTLCKTTAGQNRTWLISSSTGHPVCTNWVLKNYFNNLMTLKAKNLKNNKKNALFGIYLESKTNG